ncbi:hypothetical protein AVEN_135092-1 [Araneus ventricosus]|uniref:Uncharacterized protein n=1 Tax=Araneus ventricosus TaxID=182803 RepID=A0A4Y2S830_ARAVE|nr:hypothetical protein AVEN_135092-1 [Araneus ventricosus]
MDMLKTAYVRNEVGHYERKCCSCTITHDHIQPNGLVNICRDSSEDSSDSDSSLDSSDSDSSIDSSDSDPIIHLIIRPTTIST